MNYNRTQHLQILLFLSIMASTTLSSQAQSWIEVQRIDRGTRIGIFGDRILLTSTSDPDRSGAVFERERSGSWTQAASLSPSDDFDCCFGLGGAWIYGDTALIESYTSSSDVYVFDRDDAGNWNESTKLVPPRTSGGLFGERPSSISMFRETALIGDDQAAYVLERDENGDWTNVAKLTGPESEFGRATSIFGNKAIVGAPSEGAAGAAYVYERNALGRWTQVTKLMPSDVMPQAGFGNTVSLYGHTALVGTRRGEAAAYFFERDSLGNWAETAKLTLPASLSAEGGLTSYLFGDTALITAYNADVVGIDSGAAFIFQRDAEQNWSQVATLAPDDLQVSERFGIARGLFGDIAVIGSHRMTRIYQLTGIAEGDYDRSGTVDQADLDLVLLNWGSGDAFPPLGWYSQLPDGPIDQSELDRVLLNWGNTSASLGSASASPAVPEPRSVVLLLVSLSAYLAVRSRTGGRRPIEPLSRCRAPALRAAARQGNLQVPRSTL
jgi:hypothetical protein